jgi:hypothetical protein
MNEHDSTYVAQPERQQPEDDGQRALRAHEAAVRRTTEDPQVQQSDVHDLEGDTRDLTDSARRAKMAAEPMQANPTDVQPQRPSSSAYDQEGRDFGDQDADYDAPEKNRKDGSA